MRAEHAELRRLMGEVSDHLAGAAADGSTPPLAALTARIYAHNGKEERILYPAIDAAACSAALLDELVGRLLAS